MRVLFLVFLSVLAVVLSIPLITEADKAPAVRPELIEQVNALKTTWKAAMPLKFTNATIAHVKALLGTVLPGDSAYVKPETYKTVFKTVDADIPDSFDVRTGFPNCAAISGHVRDQSDCGSCWAMAATESFNDRYCIKTGDAKTLFSTEDTTACCSGFSCSLSMGCNGGQPSGAWKWFTKTGVSSGGDYEDVGTGATCKPNSMQSCAHHVAPPPGIPACDSLEEYDTPKCTSTCSDAGYSTPYSKDKHFASSSYAIKSVSDMQKELMEHGSMAVAMKVYDDFEVYSSGIYQHVSGDYLGGHAIKLVGWGVDNGVKYWTCINSWNTYWGESGSFRILRGVNECGIEDDACAGDA